jgi:hypothetical protein
MAESIVTSVPDPSTFSSPLLSIQATAHQNNNNLIHLELRNQAFSIDREALMELPESILLCLFPNGVVLSQKQQQRQQPPHEQHQPEHEHEVYYVDVSLNSSTSTGT